ncbi:MAG TPA: glycosyltransferase family 2 protein [Chryseosolibacter sp.]
MEKISLITVCYNSSATIRETLDSVLSQDYPNIEYIVLDGGSNDGTQEIIKEYADRISVFKSEKDKGLYDAMNKAIDLTTGSIVGILNSDDLYFDSSIISRVMREFEGADVACVFGDLTYFKTGEEHKVVRTYNGSHFKPQWLKFGILPPHPTFFVRRTAYEKYGKFDLQFRYAADFDLMARFLYVNSLPYKYLPITMVRMRLGGISTGSLSRIVDINKEALASCRKNGIKTNFFLFHFKYLWKLLQVKSFSALINKKEKEKQ